MRILLAISFGFAAFLAAIFGLLSLAYFSQSQSAIHEGVAAIVGLGCLLAWLIASVCFSVILLIDALKREIRSVREENRRICKALMERGLDVCDRLESLRPKGKQSAA